MYDCNPGSLCTGNYTCEVGYTGRMCADCAEGYFRAFDNCLECISPGGNIIAMLCMYALFVYLVVGLSRDMETIHLLMNFCQTLSIIALFNMQWPLIMEYIFNIAGILSFEMDIIQPQCATDNWGFAENLYIQLSYPAFFFVFQGLWVGAIYLAYRTKMKMDGKTLEDFSSADFTDSLARRSASGSQKSFTSQKSFGSANMEVLEVSGWWLFLQNYFHIPSSPQEMNEVILEKMSIPFMAFNLGYVVILKYCLQAFSCLDFEGTSYLYFDPDTKCYTPEHFEMMAAAGAGLILYIGGTWIMFIYVLYVLKKTKSFSKKRPLLLFGWMYERYESKFYWFELSVLFEKTVLVVVAVFIKTDPILQVVIMLIVTLATMLLSIKTSAPVDSTTAMLLTATEGVQMVIMVLGLIFYNAQVLDRTYTITTVIGSVALIGLLAALTVVFFVEVAFHIVITVLRARHKNVASKWGQDARLHTHMYRVFKPWFMFKWLSQAEPEDWLLWHRLCKLFHDSVHPTCETSYLSHEKAGHFWAYLINSFPEMLDFLASVEEVDRNEFVNVIDVMYEHYFDSAQTYKCQLNSVITDRFRAAIGQWLSSATDSEMVFVRKVITRAFAKAQGKEAEDNITRAFSRSSKSRSRMSEGDLTTKKLLGYNEDDEEDGKRFSLAGTSNAGSTALTDRFLALNPGDPSHTQSNAGTPRGKKSAKVSPGVNFADSHVPSPLGGKPATVSPFAVAQGVKVEPGKENGHHSEPGSFDTVDSNGNPQNGGSVPVAEESMPMLRDKPMSPRGRSSNLAASNSAVPQEIAIDTEELLRVQNNHSPRTSGQPQPQVQPPRLSMPAPVNTSIPPAPEAASINQSEQLAWSSRASPSNPEKVFEKRPSPFTQNEPPAVHVRPASAKPPLEDRPSTTTDAVRSFHELE
uniref:TRP C-terminal domain-containing protein n=3 Tax=Dunaliella tertiolecta TaxID=3047 RepID=A0A7S3QS60_DUNTE